MRLPTLCNPWKADGFFSFQVTMSARHRSACCGWANLMLVAPMLYQSAVIASFFHLVTSGQVLVRSCGSVLAVIVTRASGQVSSAHEVSMEIRQDLPIPLPDAMAILSTLNLSGPLRWREMLCNIFFCQLRGPLNDARSPAPQSKANSE